VCSKAKSGGRIPQVASTILTAIVTFIILGLQRYGFRPMEAVITALVGVIALCYVIETLLDRPEWGVIAYHAIVPQFSGTESILLASGILGATVMPHVIYLHSALTQGRIVTRDPPLLKKLLRFEIIDVVIAMGLAGLVNAAMLIMVASTFFRAGLSDVGTIEEAHKTLAPYWGRHRAGCSPSRYWHRVCHPRLLVPWPVRSSCRVSYTGISRSGYGGASPCCHH